MSNISLLLHNIYFLSKLLYLQMVKTMYNHLSIYILLHIYMLYYYILQNHYVY